LEESQRRAFALRRYTVFNAQQIDGVSEFEAAAGLDFNPIERAESVMAALQEQTGLVLAHGGTQARYLPALDEVRSPQKTSFQSVYDYYATAIHEGAHSLLHQKRLDRKRLWEKSGATRPYAVEELRPRFVPQSLLPKRACPLHSRISTTPRLI